MMSVIRLQKFLSTAGICSRRQGEVYIKEGLVKVNGRLVTQVGIKIDPEKDEVSVGGKLVKTGEETICIALNKPRGYVTSCKQKNEKIILDLIDIPRRIYPVGRLDKESTGLIILTNDGGLHHRLSHPSFDHEKEYEVVVADPITDAALEKLEKGMPMMGTKTRPAEVKRMSSRRFRITLKEGRNRQIRRMVRKVGTRVVQLKRIRVSTIRLGKLPEGGWRYLNETEKESLIESVLK